MNAHAQIVEFREARNRLAPMPPRQIRDLNIDEDFLVELLIKTIHRLELERASELGRAMKIPGNVVADLLAIAEGMDVVETVLELGGALAAEPRYALTSKGQGRASEAFSRSEYYGPVPVALSDFSLQIEKQSIRNETVSRSALEKALEGLALSPDILADLGAALSPTSSILLYGPGANGKSSIARAICDAFKDTVYLPHAVIVDKQVITIYDPAVHQRVEDAPRGTADQHPVAIDHDPRYIACRRPAVIAGGELMHDQLDLTLNTVSGLYETPIQLKAAGGVLVIDDFGRQRQSPQGLMNRLSIPLERGVDHLSLQTGRTFHVPFDALVVIATSGSPRKLLDGVTLRRFGPKVLVREPDRETYARIFRCAAKSAGLRADKRIKDYVLDKLYGKADGIDLAASHPQLLIKQVQALSAFEGARPQLRRDLLERAWHNLFAVEEA